MAAIFARFLPHLPLDAASVAAAADRRNEWLFSGYIPDPGRTDQLLTKMSQECFCTVFKDLDGVYKITADDPDHTPVLHLESRQDILLDSLAVEGGAMDQVFTDFYLWYQRVTTQVTTSQAGQYAAVLYATPDASISQYSELQTLCQQAADAFHTRTRFDFYSDFIADPATADLLLARLVRQFSVLRQDVTLQATLPAVPLSITDHVAVHAPLLGPQPFVGALRRAALAFAAQTPGMALSLTLRQSGLARGTWEAWDVGALGGGGGPGDAGPGGGPGRSWPPGTPRVRETWPASAAPTGGPWYPQDDLADQTPAVPCLYALCRYSNTIAFAGVEQVHGAGGGPLDVTLSGQAQAPAWYFADQHVPSGHWAPSLIGAPAVGRGTALWRHNAGGGAEQVFVAFERQSGTSEVWCLGLSVEDSEYQLFTLPSNSDKSVWAMVAYNFNDGAGVGLYVGCSSGATFGPNTPQMYRWNMVDTLVPRVSEGVINRRMRAIAVDPGTGVLWAAQDNDPFSFTGNVVMYRILQSDGTATHTTTPGGVYRQTCNMQAFGGTLWGAFGVQDRSAISLCSITHGVGDLGHGIWEQRETIPALVGQMPGCLAAFDGRLWLGCLSTTAGGPPAALALGYCGPELGAR